MTESHSQGAQPNAGLLAFTIDPNTAQIIKLECLESSGDRHEMSDEEKASLVHRPGERTLEQFVESAFEAGIACVLGDGQAADEPTETLEDVELTHRLLVPLLEHSAAKELVKRDVLDRAILDTLIAHSMTSGARGGDEAGFR